jgi:hypothetical protein
MDPRRLLPPLAVSMLLTLLLAGWVAVRDEPGTGHASRGAPTGSAASPAAPAASATLAPSRAALAAWDEARSRAWARGDVRALRGLYVPGSRTARADAAMLREYAARDLVVRGLTTQVLELRVLEETDTLLRLRVTDRVAGGEVVGADGAVRATLPTALPTDRASTRVVTMRWVGTSGSVAAPAADLVWLVDEVRGAP